MRRASTDQFSELVEEIIDERREQSKVLGQQFIGVSKKEMLSAIDKWVDDDWLFVKENPKFNKEDIDAVARNRFLRKVGRRMLILLTAIILALTMLLMTFHVITPVLYYGLCSLTAVVFLYIYTKKEREMIINLRQATNIRVVDKTKSG